MEDKKREQLTGRTYDDLIIEIMDRVEKLEKEIEKLKSKS